MTPVTAPIDSSGSSAVPVDVRPDRSGAYPSGPPFLPRLLCGRLFTGNALTNMTQASSDYGDLVHYQVFGRHV
jgi:hypothetical protein